MVSWAKDSVSNTTQSKERASDVFLDTNMTDNLHKDPQERQNWHILIL